MWTTLNLADDAVEELMKITKERTKAINETLRDYIRQKRLSDLNPWVVRSPSKTIGDNLERGSSMKSDVIADTSAWVHFFNRPHSKEKRIIDELLSKG